ncbi:uncharacterized protein FIESC28_04115 [Fusarium coffeatum]|uniref:Uncharacterized protein n=1 Tax=Fusarium coffeatum TaxID=231269 RepID=A0A366S378_9HYPO|nr:uncharacterized protein FIESC28_04115 [Fusarium coffeatum]RBR23120.1 hypothetical protein FIESC28_04115 [Fusarium coffeatum]
MEKKDADLKASDRENTSLEHQLDQKSHEIDQLKEQVNGLQIQVKEERERTNKDRDTSEEMQKLQDENESLKKQAEEAEKENKEKLKDMVVKADEHFQLRQRAEKRIQELESALETQTRLREDAVVNQERAEAIFQDVLNRARQQRRDFERVVLSAMVYAASWAMQWAMQPHGYIQPGQILPVQNTYPGPFQPPGPAQNNQNMCGPYRNFSDPHPEMYSVTNTTQVTNESRISDIPRDNNPGPSRQQHQNSSGPRTRVDSTTDTTQDSGSSSSSDTLRDNTPEPSRQPNQNSSGPDPKANNTVNNAKNTKESRSPRISRNNYPGPSSCGPTIVNSVNLEYIWYTDPVDDKHCETIRVSRGMENNVAAKVPCLDYVWAANVDNLQGMINLYNHTPGTKASIIMVKHIDARITEEVRLDWRLFEKSLSQRPFSQRQ